jgi:cytoskeletal protein CcmA (bactofilin family)
VKLGRSSERSEPINAWLGREIRLEGGELSFEGCLRIDGAIVSGSLTGPSLVVGEEASVSGRLEVGRLTVYGRVDAEALVADEVLIAPAGEFRGDLRLRTPQLTVEDGGTLNASVRVQDPPPKGAGSGDR